MTTKSTLQAEFEKKCKESSAYGGFLTCDLNSPFRLEPYLILAFFASRFPQMVMELVGGSKEALQKKRWIEHGRQCAIRTRPCGAVEHPDRLADICSARSYDFETISAFNEEIKHRLVEDGWIKQENIMTPYERLRALRDIKCARCRNYYREHTGNYDKEGKCEVIIGRK